MSEPEPPRRQVGPLLFEVAVPAGWQLDDDDDPLARPFLETSPSLAGAIRVPVTLRLPPQPELRAWQLMLATAGWLLESTPDDPESLRWSLPDPGGSFLWRATWATTGVVVELGRRLVDETAGRLRNPLRYPLDQILAIHTLARHGGFLLHAAGWARGENALAAAGVSGAGKTTLSKLLRDADPALKGLSDDRVLITRDAAGTWQVWGTPWAGEGRVAANASAHLQALLVLEHAGHEELVPLDPRTALERLLPAASVPWYDPERSALVLALLEDLVRQVPTHNLRCRPLPSAAELALTLL